MFSITFESMAIYHFFNYQYYIFSIIGKSLEKQKKYIYNEHGTLRGGEEMSTPVTDRIKNTIDENLESDISLSEIAKKIGISVFYMSHIFKKQTGMTIVEYRTAARIEKAKTLLCKTVISVTEIALRCGFSSQGYFSERFTKTVGMSPTKYRADNTK